MALTGHQTSWGLPETWSPTHSSVSSFLIRLYLFTPLFICLFIYSSVHPSIHPVVPPASSCLVCYPDYRRGSGPYRVLHRMFSFYLVITLTVWISAQPLAVGAVPGPTCLSTVSLIPPVHPSLGYQKTSVHPPTVPFPPGDAPQAPRIFPCFPAGLLAFLVFSGPVYPLLPS